MLSAEVYYESIKREPKIRGINKCRCDERLQTKTKEFTRLPLSILEMPEEQCHVMWIFFWSFFFSLLSDMSFGTPARNEKFQVWEQKIEPLNLYFNRWSTERLETFVEIWRFANISVSPQTLRKNFNLATKSRRELKCTVSMQRFLSTNIHCRFGWKMTMQKGCTSQGGLYVVFLAMIVSHQPTVWFVRVIGIVVYISPLTLQKTWATKILNRNTTTIAPSITITWDLWTLSYRKTPSIKVPCFSSPISHNFCITSKRFNNLSCFTLGSPFRVCEEKANCKRQTREWSLPSPHRRRSQQTQKWYLQRLWSNTSGQRCPNCYAYEIWWGKLKFERC